MRHVMVGIVLAAIFLLGACGQPQTEQKDDGPVNEHGYILKKEVENINDHLDYSSSELRTITFAGGCFWGVEAYMARVYGVKDVVSGYANGKGKNPSYEEVIKGDKGFAEAVEVTYDPERISLEKLMAYLFRVIDPTSLNKQGNDAGVQYRTGIYYSDEQDADAVRKAVEKEQKHYDKEIKTEALPLKNFYKAEEVHQDYLEKNPDGYCHINLAALDDDRIQPIPGDEPIVKKLSETKKE